MTATGTGALRDVIAKALTDYWNDRVDTNDPAYLFTAEQHYPEADAIVAAIAEAGLVLTPAGGLTADEREAIDAGAGALYTELGHAQDNYARARMGGDPELLAEYEQRCNRIGPQIATLKALLEREGDG